MSESEIFGVPNSKKIKNTAYIITIIDELACLWLKVTTRTPDIQIINKAAPKQNVNGLYIVKLLAMHSGTEGRSTKI